LASANCYSCSLGWHPLRSTYIVAVYSPQLYGAVILATAKRAMPLFCAPTVILCLIIPASYVAGAQVASPWFIVSVEEGALALMGALELPVGGVRVTVTPVKVMVLSAGMPAVLTVAVTQTVAPWGMSRLLKCAGGRHTY
jgi:hypothetical protein